MLASRDPVAGRATRGATARQIRHDGSLGTFRAGRAGDWRTGARMLAAFRPSHQEAVGRRACYYMGVKVLRVATGSAGGPALVTELFGSSSGTVHACRRCPRRKLRHPHRVANDTAMTSFATGRPVRGRRRTHRHLDERDSETPSGRSRGGKGLAPGRLPREKGEADSWGLVDVR